MQVRMSKEKSKKRKSKNRFLIVFGIVTGLLILGSFVTLIFYKNLGEKIVEIFLSRKIGGDVQIQDEGKKVSYTSGEGNFSLTEGGDLPAEFPSNFPIYTDAKIKNSWSATGEATQGVSVVWETEAVVKEVADFYNEKLPSGNWKVTDTFSDDSSTTISFEKDNVSGFVGITSGENNKTTISVSLGVKKQ